MCKKILLIILILVLIPSALALDMCTDTKEIYKDCKMITPVLNCTEYNYTIIEENSTIVETGNLTNLNLDVYYFNFTQGKGDYIIYLCDGTTREVRVKTTDTKMIAIILMFSISIIFFSILGFIGEVGMLKYASYAMAFVEMVLAIGAIYVTEAGGDIVGLLRMNLYSVLIIGVGLLMMTLLLKPVQMIKDDDWEEAPKWGGK